MIGLMYRIRYNNGFYIHHRTFNLHIYVCKDNLTTFDRSVILSYSHFIFPLNLSLLYHG